MNSTYRHPGSEKALLFPVTLLIVFFCHGLSLWGSAVFAVGGVVHDRSGAVIPGALVTVRRADTEAVLSTQTNDEGAFRIELPVAGSYLVEVSANGFTTYKAGAAVTSAEPAANLDIAVAVSGNTQTVEVTADALEAETTSTQLGEVLDTKKIEGVPLNGRSFTDLMAVQPGIVPQNTAQPGAVIMTGVA
ncbi:MAG: carboxypeptidase-like regulatory domain-containing protein, partial [Candidatus Sulfotelmatobacter sp.]